ncbi:MAG TPA: type II toxin-antitoxin system PemK/MazF family toxin [Methanothrix sp.]|nr:type II toxin-antitoxin system PemK/MazF family toxin [Methanothrix sp.]HOV82780.1 type II toxin-antitoxin system PemK/MazF family toxin [Methanothrix sp.]HPC88778.1 type II toxin-antitoxin system PemK/MazF family toxin [Methanothrix sp.]HQE86844.1 type II toxin-antitoxin system PemK/MazF family toxin [Methanothrix sp.]HQI69069.1 type II toxin-antitoxin system PemK/MazF family toxin [Methanothrix sp.]
MNESLKKGDIVLAPLSYSDLVNEKLRPSLVLYHDMDVMQLTVAYISSKVVATPGPYDIVIPLGTPSSTKADLIYDSVVKVCWIAMVKRILVKRKLGEADEGLRGKINQVLPEALAI